MPAQLIIFDCDGTLVDSEVLGNRVLVELVGEHGLKISTAEALEIFRGGKMAECVAELERRLGRTLPDDFVAELRRRTAEAFKTSLQPIGGALDLVRSVKTTKCVASSAPRSKIELSLSVTGLLPYFEGKIFSAYEVGAWKPAPDLFLHAARVMGFAPADCAVVEDSLPGVRAGVAAGMQVFMFAPPARTRDLPEGVVRVEDLAQLRRILE